MNPPRLLPLIAVLVLAACSSTPEPPAREPVQRTIPRQPEIRDGRAYFSLNEPGHREQIVISAYGLLSTGYRFGGDNPEAGLDCSGMVTYLVSTVADQRLPHNAARIAAVTRPIARKHLQAGDLVFFNTTGKRYSHMGIYLGDDKFIHAPNSRGKVRVERLSKRYFSKRFTGARTLLASE